MTVSNDLWKDLPEDNAPMIEWALCYARHGIPVFPVKPRTKTGYYCYPEYAGSPTAKYPEGNPFSWKAQASTDPERIRRFWTDHPDANICGATGAGLLVLDLDKEHVNEDSAGKKTLVSDGWERLRKWSSDTGQDLNLETAMSITGRGGNQLFYQSDPQKTMKGSSNIFGDNSGCDTRGDGNYVMLPPSIHPNGSRYLWEQSPDEYPVLKADQAVFTYWQGSAKNASRSGSDRFDPYMKVTSNRHDYLSSYIGWMLKAFPNLKQSQYEDMLRKKNAEDVFPPLGDNKDDLPDELERTMFPEIRKFMISDGTHRQETQKQADQFMAAFDDEANWKSLMQTFPEPANVVQADPIDQQKDIDDLDLPTMEDFEEKETEWLVKGYIPKGCITILAGTGGTGKSSIWASLLSSLSSGQPTILEGPYGMERDPVKVMYITTEDDIERVVKPKLRKNHANQKNVITMSPLDKRFEKVIIGTPFFEKLIRRHKPALCLIDPLQSFIDPKVRMAERNAMRQTLGHLLTLGMECGTAFIILMHTNKMNGTYGRQRIADSSDMWDIARSVLMLGETGEDELKYISHEKSNYGRLGKTVTFKIVDSVPVFQSYSDKKDRDYILDETKKKNSKTDKNDSVQECINIILSELSDNEGKAKVEDIDDLLKSMGYSSRNIKDAKHHLYENKMIETKKDGMSGKVDMIRVYEEKS